MGGCWGRSHCAHVVRQPDNTLKWTAYGNVYSERAMMELAFTPHGRITVVHAGESLDEPADSASRPESDSRLAKVAKAFAASEGEGLFLLATERFDGPLPPSLAYWRDFAGRYLTELCHTPEGEGVGLEAIAPPETAELDAVLLNAPPMQGAEYLSRVGLIGVWSDLDAWVRGEVAARRGWSAGLPQAAGADCGTRWGGCASIWPRTAATSNYPFAFLATYAPGVTPAARVQYQPLSRALRELAGAKNKQALVRLLSPVQMAPRTSRLVKELLDSGDLYQPLAWTPRARLSLSQGRAFVRGERHPGAAARLVEEAPAAARRRDHRRAAAEDSSTPTAMLDFKVEVGPGRPAADRGRMAQLMAADDGLVLLRGQWVEVDRQKLQEALDHWKQVQQQADEGISFVEGMRLLAGVPADLAGDGPAETDEREWSFVHAGQWLGDVLAKMRSPESLRRDRSAGGLKATLRKYQETGVGWLRFLSSLGLGACLADDMGLGKTIQVLALLLAMKEQGEAQQPSLLVLPASLLANWKAEMARFTPTLRAVFVHPSPRRPRTSWNG